MRVLWFSINASCYSTKITTAHNGGGWVSSLEKIVSKRDDIHLGIAFEYNSPKFKDTIGNVDYYPIRSTSGKFNKIRKNFTISHEESLVIPECLKIIDDFKPDVIQCFGSEWCFGLVAKHTNIPVVIHMQGSMPSYVNSLYPPRYSKYSKFFYDLVHCKFKSIVYSMFVEIRNKQRAEREERILKANNNFLGRTDWDKSITKLFSPQSNYYVCNEVLRDSFQDSASSWHAHNSDEIILCTTGNGSLWKGLDVVLKTAKILKEQSYIKFKWLLIGGSSNKNYIEWMENLKFADNDIEFLGILSENQLKETLLSSDIYVHTAYIDNSPNALCEAMILGVPCIASYVGGIPSLITNEESGILVPVNEPYYLAEKIIMLSKNKSLQERLSKKASEVARQRHSPQNIGKELISAYEQIIKIENEKDC